MRRIIFTATFTATILQEVHRRFQAVHREQPEAHHDTDERSMDLIREELDMAQPELIRSDHAFDVEHSTPSRSR